MIQAILLYTLMTTQHRDVLLYRRAREWLKLHKITLSQEDAKERDASSIIADSAYSRPVLLRGTRESGRLVVFMIVPHTITLTKQADVKKMLKLLPSDDSADVIVASDKMAPSLAQLPGFVNVTHDVLAYNPLRHVDGPKTAVIVRDAELAAVLDGLCTTDLTGLPALIRASDPTAFWLGATDCNERAAVCATIDVEDTHAIGLTLRLK